MIHSSPNWPSSRLWISNNFGCQRKDEERREGKGGEEGREERRGGGRAGEGEEEGYHISNTFALRSIVLRGLVDLILHDLNEWDSLRWDGSEWCLLRRVWKRKRMSMSMSMSDWEVIFLISLLCFFFYLFVCCTYQTTRIDLQTLQEQPHWTPHGQGLWWGASRLWWEGREREGEGE